MSSSLQVFAPTDAILCGATDIVWTYTGVEDFLSLNVTNIGVDQRNPTPPVDSPTAGPQFTARAAPTSIDPLPSPINRIIGPSLNSNSEDFLWGPIAVPSGWYIIRAAVPAQDVIEQSGRFFVRSGTDTSCLAATSPSSTAGASSFTSPSDPVTSTFVTAPSTSGTSVPVAAAAASSGLSKGAIAGIAIGAIALVLGWLAAWWFFFRKSKRTPKGQGNGGGKSPGHRSALASMDSTSGLMGKPHRSPFGSRQASTGTIPLSPLDDEKGSMRSGRKYSASSAMALGLPPLDYTQGSRRPSGTESVYGRQSLDSYPPTLPQLSGMSPTPFILPGLLECTPSINTSTTHQPSTFSQGGGPQSATSHGHTGLLYRDTPSSSAAPSPSPYSTREPDSPSSPSDASDVTRQTRRGSVSNALNKKRKPVPVYDAGAEELTPVSASATPIPASSSPSPVPPSSTPPPMSNSHYTTRNRSQPELTHKSSFGPGGVEGKPLHFLIPDMPLSSKD